MALTSSEITKFEGSLRDIKEYVARKSITIRKDQAELLAKAAKLEPGEIAGMTWDIMRDEAFKVMSKHKPERKRGQISPIDRAVQEEVARLNGGR